MAQVIRTFIAIELDDALHRTLRDLQAQFKRERAARGVRWVTPENIHVTLKFLGDVSAEQIPAIQRALADACAGIAPFALSIADVGAFPNTRRPNVVWVGARDDAGSTALLAKRVDDACAALGFAREERAFTPHLTLGRVHRDAAPSDRQFIGEMILNAKVGDLGRVRVERVSVMKSELRPGGSVYTRLGEVQLTDDG